LHKIDNPKMKNLKHLQFTNIKVQEVVDYLNRGEPPGNHIIKNNIKRILESRESGKEVW